MRSGEVGLQSMRVKFVRDSIMGFEGFSPNGYIHVVSKYQVQLWAFKSSMFILSRKLKIK